VGRGVGSVLSGDSDMGCTPRVVKGDGRHHVAQVVEQELHAAVEDLILAVRHAEREAPRLQLLRPSENHAAFHVGRREGHADAPRRAGITGPGRCREQVGGRLICGDLDIDTTTPMGKLLFQVTGAFAEFERAMIRQRVRAGLSIIKDKIDRDGKFVTKAGKIRRRLGRPGAEPQKLEVARTKLAEGVGIGKVARLTGLGTGTVHRLKRGMVAHSGP